MNAPNPCASSDASCRSSLRVLLISEARRLAVPARAVDLLVERAQIRLWRARRTVFTEAGRDASLRFLVSGAIKIVRRVPRALAIRIIRPGWFMSPTPICDRSWSWRYAAITQAVSTEAVWSHATIRDALRLLPPEALLALAGQTWQALSWIIRDKCHLLTMPLPVRLEHELEILAADFGRPHPKGTLIDLALRHADLAELAVGTRANITRCMQALRDAGRVEIDARRIVILGRPVLNGPIGIGTPHGP